MSDNEWIRRIERIQDPRQLLHEVREHFGEIPTDPYYRELSDALLDQCKKLAIPEGWFDISLIPVDEYILVKSVTGVECEAKVRGKTAWIREADRWGPRRVGCTRKTKNGTGDISAVAWRPIDEEETRCAG